MTRQELIKDLRNLVPTVVLNSLANLYKSKIIPSCEDVDTLREDVLDLGVCVSEVEEVVNYNAVVLDEELDNVTDVVNSHADIIDLLIKRVVKLEKKYKSK